MMSRKIRSWALTLLTKMALVIDRPELGSGSDFPIVCKYCGLPEHWHQEMRWHKNLVPFVAVAKGNQLMPGEWFEYTQKVMAQTLDKAPRL